MVPYHCVSVIHTAYALVINQLIMIIIDKGNDCY